jgi:hypothetical protein
MQGEEMIFIGNRASSVTTLLLALVAGALGIWALLFEHLVLGLIILIGAAVTAGMSLPMVFAPRSRYLQLDPDGFEVCFRRDKDRIKWDDVAEFRWGFHNDAPVIEIEYVADYAQRKGLAVAGNGPATGRILDRYNAPLVDILSALVDWRRRFGR